jgi:hypothetical protein
MVINYQGYSKDLAEGKHCIDGGASATSGSMGLAYNDSVSSVRIQPGYELTLYDEVHWQGQAITLDTSCADLSAIGWNDRSSRWQVAKKAT